MRRLNIDGDGQADLTVHGGPDKAVYAYPSEHYGPWAERLGYELSPGNFGENLTTQGLLEDAVHIGDEFRVGTARLVVTQPRLPCFKLGIRFGDPGMVKTFLQAGKPGIYFAVLEEGEVGPGDPIERLVEDDSRITVTDMFRSCSIKTPLPPRCDGSSACRPWRPSGGRRWRSALGSEARAPSTGRRAAQTRRPRHHQPTRRDSRRSHHGSPKKESTHGTSDDRFPGHRAARDLGGVRLDPPCGRAGQAVPHRFLSASFLINAILYACAILDWNPLSVSLAVGITGGAAQLYRKKVGRVGRNLGKKIVEGNGERPLMKVVVIHEERLQPGDLQPA